MIYNNCRNQTPRWNYNSRLLILLLFLVGSTNKGSLLIYVINVTRIAFTMTTTIFFSVNFIDTNLIEWLRTYRINFAKGLRYLWTIKVEKSFVTYLSSVDLGKVTCTKNLVNMKVWWIYCIRIFIFHYFDHICY